jgi:hypothetical protein
MAVMSTLTDVFTTKDETKWRHVGGTSWVASETISSGRLALACTSGYLASLESVDTYDLTNSAAVVEIAGRPTQGGDNSTEMYFGVSAGTSKFEFILGGSGGITYDHRISGSAQAGGGSTTYSTTAMRFLRVAHNGSAVVLQSGPKADGPWATHATFSTSLPTLTAARAYFKCGYWGTQATPGTALYDNFNVTNLFTLTTETASASSEYPGYGVQYAWDDDTGTLFNSSDAASQWAKGVFGAAVKVTSYALTARSDANAHQPRSWKLQGSNNGSSWTDLDTVTNNALGLGECRHTSLAAESASYTQLRVLQTDTTTDGTNYLILAEVDFYGTLAPTSTTVTKTQPATARIATTRTKTQPALARISTTATKTQPATARLATTGTKTQPATARIQVAGAYTKTQPATARIATNATRTQTATAHISDGSGLLTKTQTATARIAGQLTRTQTATAYISATIYRFEPPVVAEVPRTAGGPGSHDRFWSHIRRGGVGGTVLKHMDGTYSTVVSPTTAEMQAAAAAYLGGHVYYVSAAEAAALIAAGYTVMESDI